MTFRVLFSVQAQDDLDRLLQFLLDRAQDLDDLGKAQEMVDAVRAAAMAQLSRTPFSFRKAGRSMTRRELIIPSGATGYVALYEIVSPSLVLVLAVRHQREEDYH